MKRRGSKVLLYLILIFCQFNLFGNKVFGLENNENFLQLPLASKLRVLQGWLYTVKVNGGYDHGAMDYDCELGESVYAASDGVAMSSKQISIVNGAGYGNFVLIKHENGYASLYGHLEKSSEVIKVYPEGQRWNTTYSEWTSVKKGQYVGSCGTSGTDNVHLHFEITTGKFAVGRVDSYDLYTTRDFYPPNKSFIALGEKHLWEHNPPQYPLAGIADSSDTKGVMSEKSTWEKVKDLFNRSDTLVIQGERVVDERVDEKVGKSIEFVDNRVEIGAKPGEEMSASVRVKNTGQTIWKKDQLSLNVVGGASLNSMFRHTSWITDLRPALLGENEVRPGEIGTFAFKIKNIETEGEYLLRVIVVEVGSWTQIGKTSAEVNIMIENDGEVILEEIPDKNEENSTSGIVKGIREVVEEVKDFTGSIFGKVVDTIQSIPHFFGGNGNGNPSQSEDESLGETDIQWFTVLNPVERIVKTSSTTVFIYGERSEGVVVEVNIPSSTIEYGSEAEWSARVDVLEGYQTIVVSGKGVGEKVEIEVYRDSVPPTKPVIEILSKSTSTVELVWKTESVESNPENSQMYFFLEKKREELEWEEVITRSTSTGYYASLDMHHKYSFRVRAEDEFGNKSEWSDSVSLYTEWSKEVVLSEIAWAGASMYCPEKEWIELYNPGETEIVLDGWSVEIDESPAIELSGEIESGGYYLVSHEGLFSVISMAIDASIPTKTRIPDSGGKIILRNNEGEIVDEVNQSRGWLGGSVGEETSTLMRVSSELPSFNTETWVSSETVRYGMKSGGCGRFAGSPNLDNYGYVYISREVMSTLLRTLEGDIVLTKKDSPYIFDDFEIQQDDRVIVESGVVLAAAYPTSRITLDGTLLLRGELGDQVVITSVNDRDFVATSTAIEKLISHDLPRSGEWQNIVVSSDGVLDAVYAKLRYGGNRYGNDVWCPACARSRVLSNEGGKIFLENVDIGYGYESGGGSYPSPLVYSNGGKVDLKKVTLHHGKEGLYVEGSASVSADELYMHDFDTTSNVVYFKKQIPELWTNITYGENTPAYAYGTELVVTSTHRVDPGYGFEFGTVIVEAGGILEVYGGNLYATKIEVKGTLNVVGGEAEEVDIGGGGASPSATFSHILFAPGSRGNFEHARIRGGSVSSFPFSATRPYMMWIDGAVVSISNSELLDSRRPGGIVIVRSGELKVLDSDIGWSSGYKKTYPTWKEYGIVGNSQSKIHIENVNFSWMDYIVELSKDSILTHDRLSKDNLFNLYPQDLPQKNWFPTSLFSF
jgi:hypothetical protein